MPSPEEIVRTARPGHSVIGWKLSTGDREILLQRFPPSYANVVADHVTLSAKVASNTPHPEDTDAQVVGIANDGRGVEALVVEVAGTTYRPGGGIWHITWSLAQGRRPKESNDVLASQSWTPLDAPIPIRLKGSRIR